MAAAPGSATAAPGSAAPSAATTAVTTASPAAATSSAGVGDAGYREQKGCGEDGRYEGFAHGASGDSASGETGIGPIG